MADIFGALGLRPDEVLSMDAAQWRAYEAQLQEQKVDQFLACLSKEISYGTLLWCPNGYRAELVRWWHDEGRLTIQQLQEFLAQVWTDNDWPYDCLRVREWLRLFRAAGFMQTDHEGNIVTGAARPESPLLVYRGTTPAGWRRPSWTLDPEKALWFAQRLRSVGSCPDALVASTTVPPKHVLAILHCRQESEVIVNPYGLRTYECVKEVSPSIS